MEIIEKSKENSHEKEEILKFIKSSKSGIVKGFY